MRVAAILLSVVLLYSQGTPALTKPADFGSSDLVLTWINSYRHKPEPERLPLAIQALSGYGAFRDPESCGVYVGFIAGVLGANPQIAGDLIRTFLPGQSRGPLGDGARDRSFRAAALETSDGRTCLSHAEPQRDDRQIRRWLAADAVGYGGATAADHERKAETSVLG